MGMFDGMFGKKKQVIKAHVPTGRVLFVFTPVEDFHCDATGTDYVKGMRYKVREGNDALKERVQKWLEQGRVK